MNSSSKRAETRDAMELLEPAGGENIKFRNPPSSLVEVDLAAQSNVGGVKRSNEDHFLAVRLDRSLRTLMSNLPQGVPPQSVEETAYGMCVADGIGGMPAGEIASSMALRTLVELLVKTPDWIMRMNRRKAAVVRRRFTLRFRQIDVALRQHSVKDPRFAGMGTTLTVACSLGSELFLAHVGDSRAYLMRDQELHQLTKDHTLAQAMIEAGVGNEKDAGVQEMRRVLTAALGSTPHPTDPEVRRLRLMHNDQLLLCTDGLTEFVDFKTISSILGSAESSDQACRTLIDEALARECDDNVTVIVARYRFPMTGASSDGNPVLNPI